MYEKVYFNIRILKTESVYFGIVKSANLRFKTLTLQAVRQVQVFGDLS